MEEVFLQKFSKDNSSSFLIRIKVSYQWKPKQCSLCQVFGHSDQACPIKVGFPVPKVYGPGQIDGSSEEFPAATVAGQNHSGPSAPSVWRIVSKKGKARVVTEQVDFPQPPSEAPTGSGGDGVFSPTQQANEASVASVISDGTNSNSNKLVLANHQLLLEQSLEKNESGEARPKSLEKGQFDPSGVVIQSIEGQNFWRKFVECPRSANFRRATEGDSFDS